METCRNDRTGGHITMKKLVFLIVLLSFCFCDTAQAGMSDYCVTPTPAAAIAKPNILIVMDSSGSMQFPAYVSCGSYSYDGYVINCGTGSAVLPPTSGADAYNTATNYYGLFDNTKYYKHDGTEFLINTSCTNTDRIGAISGSASTACISGNLLNWISATRVDVARQILTGFGKITGTTGVYQSEGARMVFTDTNLQCKFTTTTSGTPVRRTIAIDNQTSPSAGTCVLGTMAAKNMYMPSTDTGIIQDFADKATFEFMIFNSDDKGKLLAAKDAGPPTMPISNLLNAVSIDQPYNGTPTGEALCEAEDFFKQYNGHSYYNNWTGISSGSAAKDPWYDNVDGTSKAVRCRKAFVLLISDGNWNGTSADKDPYKAALRMHTTDLRSAISDTQTVTTYVVYAFGDKDADTKLQGQQAMKTTAIFGGFQDLDQPPVNPKNGYPYPWTSTSLPADSRNITYPLTQCDPNYTATTGHSYDAACREWDRDGTGVPYNYFEGDDGEALKASITNALNDMVRRTSSGTAASVLASSEGSGASILQSVFFPKKMFGDTTVTWTGQMQNLWYYVDPYLQYSSIREDTDTNRILNLQNDYALEFYFDNVVDFRTKVKRYTTAADGSGATYHDEVGIEDVKSLWEAGTVLFQRNLTTSPRTIYTTTDGSSLSAFSTTNSAGLYQYLQAADATEATKIINYVHGIDQTGCRSRTVTISGTSGVWKLGDIVSSTPKIQSSIPTNTYHLAAPSGYSDATYLEYIRSTGYQSRGMAYVGGNDGMLHAFKFGKLEQLAPNTDNNKAQLTNPDSTPLGTEAWAFIPKNALPYLKYTMQTDYCHLNMVDLPSVLVDASINGTATDARALSSWRTVLIGGMGQGGASRISTSSCTPGASGTCVKTPINDPADSTKGLGYSSYFAIDVTNPASPQLLWELADPALGYSTSGPAIVRIGPTGQNGKWFAVFASGPTGPIDTAKTQFLGKSDQNLKLFVVELATGTVTTIDTGLSNAFGGSLYNGAADLGRVHDLAVGRYNDDVIYLGYTQKDSTAGTWTKGGVLRIVTKEDANPSNWVVRTVIDNIGPVTSSIAKVQDLSSFPQALWLYFGTGRFYYRYDTTLDDPLGKRAIYGVKDPCFSAPSAIDSTCTTTVTTANLDDQSTITTVDYTKLGWFINLDPALQSDGTEATTLATMALGAERDITDPLAVSGAVFFTTYAPSADICDLGGYTYIWAVRWNTGGALSLRGNAVTQVSTGVIQELDLSSAFGQRGKRRTAGFIGMPPKTQGLSIQVPPQPIRKFMHIREK